MDNLVQDEIIYSKYHAFLILLTKVFIPSQTPLTPIPSTANIDLTQKINTFTFSSNTCTLHLKTLQLYNENTIILSSLTNTEDPSIIQNKKLVLNLNKYIKLSKGVYKVDSTQNTKFSTLFGSKLEYLLQMFRCRVLID